MPERGGRRRTRGGRGSGALAALTVAAVAGAPCLPLRVNWSASAPLGLYGEVRAPLYRGALVAVCLPQRVGRIGRALGYLAQGGCPGGASPVLKRIVGIPGDEIEMSPRLLVVNGRVMDRTAVLEMDSLGRPLAHASFGHRTLAAHEVWLLGVHSERSWDSRYFGPVPLSSIVATARPLLTLPASTAP